MDFFARFTNHIDDDLARNWSSFNYGQEGFAGDREALVNAIESAIESDSAFWISGFSLEGRELRDALRYDRIRELSPNYWVLVDDREGTGISTIWLNANNLQGAIEEARRADLYCDGYTMDVANWQPVVVYREFSEAFGREMIILQA